jgi:hypothetical protein
MKRAKQIAGCFAVWLAFCLSIYGIGAFYEWNLNAAQWDGGTRGLSAFFMSAGLYVGVFVAPAYLID